MFPLIKDALGSAGRFVVSHPLTLLQLARHAAGLRWAIPLDAVRWLVGQLPAGGAPEDITIEARPPAIFIGATVNMMGTKVRVSGSMRFDEVRFGADTARLKLHLSDLDVKVIDFPESPLNQMLSSGAIDLEKPADLLNFVPSRPSVIVAAKGKDFELDLLQIPGMDENPLVTKLLGTVTPVLNLRAIKTENDFLIVGFSASPLGLPASIAALRG